MTTDETDVLRRIEESAVDYLRLQFTDILGTVKSVTIPASRAENAFADGVYFDGSSIEGFVRIQESDMRLVPDPSTFAVLPWDAEARLICDVIDTATGEPFVGDPRQVLRQAIDNAAEAGYELYAGPEPEFFVFETEADGAATTRTHDAGGYFDFAPKDRATDLRREIIDGLTRMGFSVEASHHEVAAGQHEIDFAYDDALVTADNVATFRTVVRAVAARHDLHATFMPKPIAEINGSGMHTHLSLWRDGENVFHDPADEFDLSDTARSFLAGVLDHAPALTAVCNPTVNSYKRLVPGYEAPVYVAWSAVNRSALVRRPAARTPADSRLELRSPDPTCNPYLALAAILQAGLDGVERELDAPAPVRENVYEFDATTRAERGIDTLPGTLDAALDALADDEVVRRALGEHVTDRFLDAKRSEVTSYRAAVSEWERDRYLETF